VLAAKAGAVIATISAAAITACAHRPLVPLARLAERVSILDTRPVIWFVIWFLDLSFHLINKPLYLRTLPFLLLYQRVEFLLRHMFQYRFLHQATQSSWFNGIQFHTHLTTKPCGAAVTCFGGPGWQVPLLNLFWGYGEPLKMYVSARREFVQVFFNLFSCMHTTRIKVAEVIDEGPSVIRQLLRSVL